VGESFGLGGPPFTTYLLFSLFSCYFNELISIPLLIAGGS